MVFHLLPQAGRRVSIAFLVSYSGFSGEGEQRYTESSTFQSCTSVPMSTVAFSSVCARQAFFDCNCGVGVSFRFIGFTKVRVGVLEHETAGCVAMRRAIAIS